MTTKTVAIKFVGLSNRATETLQIDVGTTAADMLTSLGLGTGFQLSDAKAQTNVFRANDNVYARVDDGAMLYCSAMVDAGIA